MIDPSHQEFLNRSITITGADLFVGVSFMIGSIIIAGLIISFVCASIIKRVHRKYVHALRLLKRSQKAHNQALTDIAVRQQMICFYECALSSISIFILKNTEHWRQVIGPDTSSHETMSDHAVKWMQLFLVKLSEVDYVSDAAAIQDVVDNMLVGNYDADDLDVVMTTGADGEDEVVTTLMNVDYYQYLLDKFTLVVQQKIEEEES